MEMRAESGRSFPKHPFSLLAVNFLILFIFSPIAFFFISFPLLGKRKTHTQKHSRAGN